jgi:molybdopterin molybdotransferase
MSVGISRIPVHSAPRIAVVVTGGEFTSTEHPRPGRIFSSNDAMLVAALAGLGLECTMLHAPDEDEALHRVFRSAITDHDVVITTGGVSVGDHDRVRATLEDLGTRIVFHGVSQKPGKPMLFGRSEEKAVFGLPGNPRAVMVLFWEYVLPYLRALQGSSTPFLAKEDLPITAPVHVNGGRAEFRAAEVRRGEVTLLRDEGSHMLASLVRANALVYFPQGTQEVRSGERVEVHYLPGR